MKPKPDSAIYDDLFLPNFCGMRMVFFVVVVAQLFVFVLVLMPLEQSSSDRWRSLGLVSLFVMWIALLSSAFLCLLRPYLCQRKSTHVAVISYLVMLMVIAIVSEAAYWLTQSIEMYSRYWHFQFLIRNMAIGAIISALILRYFYVQHQWARDIKAKSEARMQALQSRIRPHFLFNSMNTIASLIGSEPKKAELAIEDLADLFRMSLKDLHKRITLEEEFELCQHYLGIEALRLGERLKVDWQVDCLPKDALIPPLTLQPLVENAIYHGIELLPEGGTVSIIGKRDRNKLSIVIANPVVTDEQVTDTHRNRLALDNIRERLAAYYGVQQHVDILQDSSCYNVAVHFPYLKDEDEDSYR